MKIKKAVIPVAGKGTRFLPITKEIPKEMIPILNRPMISFVVEEAVKSGIEEIIFVTSRGKESISDYFDRNLELEEFLSKAKKNNQFDSIKKIGTQIEVISVRQKEQLGLGHAINCARPLISNEPFAVILGDDLMRSEQPAIGQLMEVYTKNNNSSVIGLFQIPKSDTFKYGVIDGVEVANQKRTYKIDSMVEKPAPEVAPSLLAAPGRYIFNPDIFDYLEKIERGAGGEYQLTDAINMMAKEKNVFGYDIDGERFDTGNIPGYLEATIAFSLDNPELRNVVLNTVEKFK